MIGVIAHVGYFLALAPNELLKTRGTRVMIYVQPDKCAGCSTCIEVCPVEAIHLVDGVATIEQEKCTECQACVTACPEGAIQVITEPVHLPVAQTGPGVIQITSYPTSRSPQAKIVPALGAMASLVRREIVPRLGPYLLDILARRLGHPGPRVGGGPPSATETGHRFRLRRRGR
ncbi:MAG: 4Fe-4S binding protein [Chloroflexi bacterium]|nr:4Fe-4S binding protein [Chloroflexota bacterium]